MKPSLLLDIDGVCLPFREFDGCIKGHASHGPFQVSVELAERIRSLFDCFLVTWCTAWEAESALFGETLDLPKAGYLTFRDDPNPWTKKGEDVTWKLGSVAKFGAATERPLIWIDDELNADAYRWARERPQTILVKTDPNVGLTETDLELISDIYRVGV